MRTRRWVGALALMATGCSAGAVEPPGTLGELGMGTFRYNCIEEGDAVCNQTQAVDTFLVSADLGINGEAPAAIAVGARFDLAYFGDVETKDGQLLLVETVPARPDAVTKVGGFVITTPGVHAFLARSPKGIVADFIHVSALEVEDLDVWVDEHRVEAITLPVGSELVLAVVPQNGTGVSLAGALPYRWQVDGDAAAIDSIGGFGAPTTTVELNDDEIRVYGAAEGTATITVERGDVQKQIQVTVEPEVTP